ncbi:MOSC domain-containing protein [Alkalicoccus halolimnae]|uniref:MOSC domain-containing protein n=1 Tax=Alkalicoccus halolimnae TaxID=1667239 RepID=A0AAJ8N3J1_9BACI|nr:MOSC domain-containing protein [Alkalicoccus halolimnae]
MVKIISLNTGRPQHVIWGGVELHTSIVKHAENRPLYLSKTNLGSDGQADLVHHGGEDKAVCVYAAEHYSYWEKVLGINLPEAAFGENFTVEGMTEETICIGDIFQVGEAVVEVSQPRQPCHKLGGRFGERKLPVLVKETGWSGYYLRVLKEGWIKPGEEMIRIKDGQKGITIIRANNVMYKDTSNEEALKEVLSEPALADAWRGPLQKRLQKF